MRRLRHRFGGSVERMHCRCKLECDPLQTQLSRFLSKPVQNVLMLALHFQTPFRRRGIISLSGLHPSYPLLCRCKFTMILSIGQCSHVPAQRFSVSVAYACLESKVAWIHAIDVSLRRIAVNMGFLHHQHTDVSLAIVLVLCSFW